MIGIKPMMEQRMVGRLDFELGLFLLAVAFRVALRGEERRAKDVSVTRIPLRRSI